MRHKLLSCLVCGMLLVTFRMGAITVGPFGPNGEGGSKNGQDITIGPGGSVFEIDAFLSVGSQDLNGAQLGTSAQLSRDALPAGIDFHFTNSLSVDQADLILTYTFSNSTPGTVFTNLHFFTLLDAEIDQATNTFFNEYGTVKGTLVNGANDGSPDQWQMDEPGFQTGTLFANLFQGALDNSNSVPQSAPNDVAMGLGFALNDLPPTAASTISVLISENGRSLGSFALVQRDLDPNSTTFITYSGGLAPALSGGVYVDANGNSFFDPGEGVPGVAVVLRTNGVTALQATTDTDGRYSFATAPPGTYSASVNTAALPAGVVLSAVPNGALANPWTITLVGGVPQTLNWGYRGFNTTPDPDKGRLVGRAFVDANQNGVFDAGDSALANLTVTLRSNAVVVGSLATDNNGQFSFGNKNTVDQPPGTYTATLATAGIPAGLNPVAVQNGSTDNPATIVLQGGKITTNNWGYYNPVATLHPQFKFTNWILNRTSGAVVGTINIANTNTVGGAISGPYWLGINSSTNFYYAPTHNGQPQVAGTNGLPYVDLTAAVKAALGTDTLGAGQSVTLTNAVEVFSRYRSAPADSQFNWVPLSGNP
ncbi:MAG TPA: SdrD B-like domain-containing protein [Dongiaceae bacterium]|nr:SdrD B-like domain-containing protein [Dongiaceae bacterium]